MLVFGTVFRLAVGREDQDRIWQYIEQRGGNVLDSKWSPFGPGWFGEGSNRIYKVRYLDRDGNEHESHCKTMKAAVYFTEDRIVKFAQRMIPPAVDSENTLEAENRRLRMELERLRAKQGKAER